MAYQYNPLHGLPSAAELPDSDDTPVDNELQNRVPNLLDSILRLIWQERTDWFFGVDMGIYYAPDKPPIVPDGFLSLGVERFVFQNGRPSYVLWEEDGIMPSLALEVVSEHYRGEYDQKKRDYAQLGILYYAIYAPSAHQSRRKRDVLEVYRLEGGEYARLPGDRRVWLPEVGLGLGRQEGTYGSWTREWLYWYDPRGNRLLAPEERAEQESQRAQQAEQQAEAERQRAERLAAKLRELGVDPESL